MLVKSGICFVWINILDTAVPQASNKILPFPTQLLLRVCVSVMPFLLILHEAQPAM